EELSDVLLDGKPVLVGPAHVDQVDLLEAGGGALEVVALDHQERALVDGRQVPDGLARRRGRLEAVEPLPPGVRAPMRVELVDDEAPLVRIGGERTLEQGVEETAIRRQRHPFEPLAAGQVRRRASERVVRRPDSGERNRRLQDTARRVGVDEERTELIAEPEAAVGELPERLDVEIAPGEETASSDGWIDGDRAPRIRATVGHDRETDLVVGVPQVEMERDADRSGPAGPGREVRGDLVDAQQVVRRVRLRAEAVVGHREIAAILRTQDRGEALHRLPADERRHATIRRTDELPRGGPERERFGRQYGTSHERGRLRGAGERAGEPRESQEPDRESHPFRGHHGEPPLVRGSRRGALLAPGSTLARRYDGGSTGGLHLREAARPT